jgi:hypothetical protein
MENTDLYKIEFANNKRNFVCTYKTPFNYHRLDGPAVGDKVPSSIVSREEIFESYWYKFMIDGQWICTLTIDYTQQKPHTCKLRIHLKEK